MPSPDSDLAICLESAEEMCSSSDSSVFLEFAQIIFQTVLLMSVVMLV